MSDTGTKLDAITVNGLYRRMPKDIELGREFVLFYGEDDLEVAARIVLRICHDKGNWRPFTRSDFDKRCIPPLSSPMGLDRLVAVGCVQFRLPNGTFQVTPSFIEKCFAASPTL